MKILVSACLLGERCRYDGGDNRSQAVCALASAHELVPACPEVLGGLPTPRTPAEISGDKVVTRDGADVTAQFHAGAQEALRIARREGTTCAILQSRSPSCGARQVYDGTFGKRLVPGMGVCAALLAQAGIAVIDAEDGSAIAALAQGGTPDGSQ